MVKKVKSELVPLTRELAERFAKMSALPGERLLRSARTRYFEARLVDHTFNSPTWSFTTIGESDHEYRADGQHTSTVLSHCDEAHFPAGLGVTINTYHLDSPEDRFSLFEIFDNPNSTRTNQDKMGVFIADYADLAHIQDRGYLVKVAHGIDYHQHEAQAANPNQKLQTYSLRDHGMYFDHADNRTFASWLYRWREAEHAWMIGKPGIVAEIYADWGAYPILAGEFWAQVLTESHPDPEDETRELSRTLKEWSRKQPKIKQDKFRMRAKKVWDRYRRVLASTPQVSQQNDPPDRSEPPVQEQSAA